MKICRTQKKIRKWFRVVFLFWGKKFSLFCILHQHNVTNRNGAVLFRHSQGYSRVFLKIRLTHSNVSSKCVSKTMVNEITNLVLVHGIETIW